MIRQKKQEGDLATLIYSNIRLQQIRTRRHLDNIHSDRIKLGELIMANLMSQIKDSSRTQELY